MKPLACSPSKCRDVSSEKAGCDVSIKKDNRRRERTILKCLMSSILVYFKLTENYLSGKGISTLKWWMLSCSLNSKTEKCCWQLPYWNSCHWGPTSVWLPLLPCASHFAIKHPGGRALVKLYVHSFSTFVDCLLCANSRANWWDRAMSKNG